MLLIPGFGNGFHLIRWSSWLYILSLIGNRSLLKVTGKDVRGPRQAGAGDRSLFFLWDYGQRKFDEKPEEGLRQNPLAAVRKV